MQVVSELLALGTALEIIARTPSIGDSTIHNIINTTFNLYASRNLHHALPHTNGSIINILILALDIATGKAQPQIDASVVVKAARSLQFIVLHHPDPLSIIETLVAINMKEKICTCMKRFEAVKFPEDAIPFQHELQSPPNPDKSILRVPYRPNLEVMVELTAALSAAVAVERSSTAAVPVDEAVLEPLATGLSIVINLLLHDPVGPIALSAVEVRTQFFSIFFDFFFLFIQLFPFF
jgi:hypothetical protein